MFRGRTELICLPKILKAISCKSYCRLIQLSMLPLPVYLSLGNNNLEKVPAISPWIRNLTFFLTFVLRNQQCIGICETVVKGIHHISFVYKIRDAKSRTRLVMRGPMY